VTWGAKLSLSTGHFQLNGIFNLNKPAGISSHAVVSAVRKFSSIPRVGHGGTLDPMATGVLLVCVGQAVRVTEYLIDHDKKYRARVRLGIETDTYDATGRVVSERAVSATRDEIERALGNFVGNISQYPPAYSAIKRDGVALYRLARRGVEVETEAREVEIFSLTPVDVKVPQVEFDVHCSKGTYIRSLAHDLGQVLGSGAHLSALTRLASGKFKLEDSLTLDQLREAFGQGIADKYLIPLDRALEQFDSIKVDAASARQVINGINIVSKQSVSTSLARLYSDGQIIALMERTGEPEVWKPKKVFVN
jgi:tRNA pseudouridine55 synthase